MLTLTRRVGETIRIGDNIEIVVKEIRRGQVRIGINAPREIPVLRGELIDDEDLSGRPEDAVPNVDARPKRRKIQKAG